MSVILDTECKLEVDLPGQTRSANISGIFSVRMNRFFAFSRTSVRGSIRINRVLDSFRRIGAIGASVDVTPCSLDFVALTSSSVSGRSWRVLGICDVII